MIGLLIGDRRQHSVGADSNDHIPIIMILTSHWWNVFIVEIIVNGRAGTFRSIISWMSVLLHSPDYRFMTWKAMHSVIGQLNDIWKSTRDEESGCGKLRTKVHQLNVVLPFCHWCIQCHNRSNVEVVYKKNIHLFDEFLSFKFISVSSYSKNYVEFDKLVVLWAASSIPSAFQCRIIE